MIYRTCGYGCSGPLGPGSTGGLLDLPVRTDTNGVSRGLKGVVFSDPFRLIRCDLCGLPITKCDCLAGKDY